MIVYPNSGYDSFVSIEDANIYFSGRLHADEWFAAGTNQEAALMTAYRSLNELSIEIDLTDSDALEAIRAAQCEQALYELKTPLDEPHVQFLGLGGSLAVRLGDKEPSRYSERAIAILKPYLNAQTVTRTR